MKERVLKVAKVENIVYKLTEPIAEENQCEVVDVVFKKEGSDWFLRVFIDNNEGITIDDCEVVSRALSEELDRVDPITQGYYLEVSSPGINRPLKRQKDFEKFTGEEIEIKLYKAINGKKKICGILEDYKDDIIYLKDEEGELLKINKKDTALVKLV